MSRKHTAGPWGYLPETGEVYYDDGDVRPQIATVDLIHVESEAQALADLHLIAAAPDLLEALELLLAEVEASGNATASDYGWPKAVSATRAAITRAREG
jgi:hypothetical protein